MKPQNSQRQISEYVHPWDEFNDKLKRPNPPTKEAIEKSQFVDRTYVWKKDARF